MNVQPQEFQTMGAHISGIGLMPCFQLKGMELKKLWRKWQSSVINNKIHLTNTLTKSKLLFVYNVIQP